MRRPKNRKVSPRLSRFAFANLHAVTPPAVPKSPSRPASIRSQYRASSPELDIPPVPTLHLQERNGEKEQATGLALSIPPPGAELPANVEDDHQGPERDDQGLHREDDDHEPEPEHKLGRRDEAIVGPAERAAESAAHPATDRTADSPAKEVQSEPASLPNEDPEPAVDRTINLDTDDENDEESATSTRTRLAEAARAENERHEQTVQVPGDMSAPGSRAHSRTGSVQFSTGVRMANGRSNWNSSAGLPAGLIYSDESDSEGSDDDDLGLGLGTNRKTSGTGSVTKSPKMSRNERDRRVFGDDLDARGLMERVKGVAGVAGAGTATGVGLTGLRQVSCFRGT